LDNFFYGCCQEKIIENGSQPVIPVTVGVGRRHLWGRP
jgi:hypothetical protein